MSKPCKVDNFQGKLMNKSVRTVSLVSLLLLVCAIGSCHVGQGQWENELRQRESDMLWGCSDLSPDTNPWQTIGFVLFFASMSIAIAAFMLSRQDNRQAN